VKGPSFRAGSGIGVALALLGTPASARETADPTISIETMKDVTRTLSSDAFEGRKPGTPAEARTLAYIAAQFAAAGLQPGKHGSWFQDVPLVEITAHDASPLVVGNRRRGAAPLSFAPAGDWIGVTYRETARTDLRDSELVFVGYGIVAPEKGWNDYAGIDMHGKTALILVNDPDYEKEGLTGPFNGRAMTYYGRWTYKFEEAARQGAAGALIVHDTFPASYGWNVVVNSWSGAQEYAARDDHGASQTQVNGWVRKPVAEAILRASGHDPAALIAAAKRPGFRPVPLGLTVSASFANRVRPFTSHNVIGVLPGRERPGEVVLTTAHWDHLGRCPANAAGDGICNGAIDNATGVAALVALAKAQAATGPAARTLAFVSFTAEEAGLLGSDYYAAHPVFPLDHTVGGLNIDGLYMTGPAHDVTVIGGGKSDLDALLAAALPKLGRVASPDSAPQAGYYYRSDHFSLARRGVPMFDLKPGEDLTGGGRKVGAAWVADYRAHRYHSPSDEYDESWDWRGAEADLRLFYILERELAESGAWPNWLPGDEFRRVRDQSCATRGGC
jgi:Zn-dependent M28 family amino/carboxypeptidase